MHRPFTDRKIKSLKPRSRTYEVWEDGMGLQVAPSGTRTFGIKKRIGKRPNPSWRAIGHYPVISLAQAREIAVQWRTLIAQGKDPAVEQERQRAAELRKQGTTVEGVFLDYEARVLSKQKSGGEVVRDFKRVFFPLWRNRPIADISPLEVVNALAPFVDAGKGAMAFNLLGYVRTFYNWAIAQQVYGLETSPCDRLKPKALIGKRRVRSRVLNETELRAA